jgi:hypothetical protein
MGFSLNPFTLNSPPALSGGESRKRGEKRWILARKLKTIPQAGEMTGV